MGIRALHPGARTTRPDRQHKIYPYLLLVQIEDMLQHSKLNNDSAAAIHFKLGKYYDSAEDYERAFHHYELANALQPAQFNQERQRRFLDDSIKVYSPSFIQRMPRATNRSKLPVFIVGMPRSGTSLVEQILASHPDVFGAGELGHIPRIAGQLMNEYHGLPEPLCFLKLTKQSLNAIAKQHLRCLQKYGGSAARVTDKMLDNVRYIGLIQQLFPEAQIIHCTRHPLDTCLSCFFANFGAGNAYAYDLTMVGQYYLQYHRLMKHWESVLPGRILRVSYSQLVQDQEATSRKLLEFCGLEWNEHCLEFYNTDRLVLTLSYDQVRQPIYTRSLGRWKRYEKYLRQLREVLETGGIDCN
jgi:hypothetical protein